MTMYFFGSLLAVVFLFFTVPKLQAYAAPNARKIFIACILLATTYLCILSYLQYMAWKTHGLAKFFLPPYRGWDYFFLHIGAKFFAPYAISLGIALVFLFAAVLLNKRFNERFFMPEEPYIAAMAIFLTGHPGWLVYLALVLVVYLAIQLWSAARKKDLPRVPLYHLWVPLALFVIITLKWITAAPAWLLLKI